MNKSQKQNILNYMQTRGNGAITPLIALSEFGVMRLAARIEELRRAGHDIVSMPKHALNGKRYAEYHLIDPSS